MHAHLASLVGRGQSDIVNKITASMLACLRHGGFQLIVQLVDTTRLSIWLWTTPAIVQDWCHVSIMPFEGRSGRGCISFESKSTLSRFLADWCMPFLSKIWRCHASSSNSIRHKNNSYHGTDVVRSDIRPFRICTTHTSARLRCMFILVVVIAMVWHRSSDGIRMVDASTGIVSIGNCTTTVETAHFKIDTVAPSI